MSMLVSLLGMGLAGYNTFNRRERLKQGALTLKSMMRFAQTKSISVNKPRTGCTKYVGMQVSFLETSYALQHQCLPEGLVDTVDTVSIGTYGLTFSPVPTNFTFNTYTTTVNLSTDLNINLTNGIETYRLVVSPNGNISDAGFQ